jgi:hypothetical protein
MQVIWPALSGGLQPITWPAMCKYPTGADGNATPTAIALDASGRIYVADGGISLDCLFDCLFLEKMRKRAKGCGNT